MSSPQPAPTPGASSAAPPTPTLDPAPAILPTVPTPSPAPSPAAAAAAAAAGLPVAASGSNGTAQSGGAGSRPPLGLGRSGPHLPDRPSKAPASVKRPGQGTAAGGVQAGQPDDAASSRGQAASGGPSAAAGAAANSSGSGNGSMSSQSVHGSGPAAGSVGKPAAPAPAAATGIAAANSSSSTATAGVGKGGSAASMPSLPPRQGAAAKSTPPPAPDAEEPEAIQQVRRQVQVVRVRLLRAAQRLGYDADNGLVRQVLYRLSLAEKLKAPPRRGVRRPDPALLAAREAASLEAEGRTPRPPLTQQQQQQQQQQQEGAKSATGSRPGQGQRGPGGEGAAPGPQPLGFTVKMMLIGLAGAGKTQLAQALLSPDSPPSSSSSSSGGGSKPLSPAAPPACPIVDAVEGATKHVTVLKGCTSGISLEIIDTPGLVAAASGVAHNARVLREVRRAYQRHAPDLVVFVERLDGGGGTRFGAELPALKGLSEALGQAFWLNTIVALTHAGSPPPSCTRGFPTPFEQWANQRSHTLQQVIRTASGDDRLMNPMAFVESHPGSKRNAAGAQILANGMPWKPHLLLMVVSAKLLADAENMLQMQGSSGGSGGGPGGNAMSQAEQQRVLLAQMMGGAGRSLPLPYLCTQATQFSQPLQYPDHSQIMQVRQAEAQVQRMKDAKQRKQMTRQVKAAVMQMKQAAQYKAKMARAFQTATLAGGKITPEPPRLATKRPPSVHPPGSYRYRVPEPGGGWVVRPSLEPHGMDVGDNIEGLQMERYGVVRRPVHHEAPRPTPAPRPPSSASAPILVPTSPPPTPLQVASTGPGPGPAPEPAPAATPAARGWPVRGKGKAKAKKQGSRRPRRPLIVWQEGEEDLLGGVPIHHFLSAQVNKGQMALQGRSEATLYHDPLGRTTTSLSADLQTTGTPGTLDALVGLRADLRRQGLPLGLAGHQATLGVLLTRLAEGGRLDRGPLAMGLRLQDSWSSQLGPTLPLDLAAAGALVAAPWGTASPASAAGLAVMGGGPQTSLDPAMALGFNVEVTADMQQLLRSRRPTPLGVNLSMLSHKGELMAAAAASMQVRGRRKDVCGARLQLSNRGKAGLSLKVHSGRHWWAGILAMAVPLGRLLYEQCVLSWGHKNPRPPH